MSPEYGKCNGTLKRKDFSQERLITYRRRKRAKTSIDDGGESTVELHYEVLQKNTYEQYRHGRTNSHWNHWRYVLENILQLPDISEGGGIKSCICDALTYGSSGCNIKPKKVDLPLDSEKLQVKYGACCEEKMHSERLDSSITPLSDASKAGCQVDINANTLKCKNIFRDILCAEKFALLCHLLCRNFQDNQMNRYFDFSIINSKMENGDYGQSPQLFDQDIQQVWETFQNVGQDMVHLASGLAYLSRASFQKQVGGVSEVVADEHKPEETCLVSLKRKNSMESYTTIQFTSCYSDHPIKPDQTEASCLYKICTCKQCGTEANGAGSLICDGCEAMYHVSCIQPAVKVIPTQSWYCAACSATKMKSHEAALTHIQEDSLHQNCEVCGRLEVSETLELESCDKTALANDNRESSVSSMETEEPLELSTTTMPQLCKLCRTCEDEDKRFLICGHIHCPYKFYHIRCLKSSQIASAAQQNKPCWYCPSCLCRDCLSDRDDDKIVLCDGCDEAYHCYCMKPPRTSVPKGQWYCVPCNVARAKEGMRKYEEWILQQHRKEDARDANETNAVSKKLKSKEHISCEQRKNVDYIAMSMTL
ncbi:PHD finger protein EHD3-like [Typha latifolia]|uniref:PHD finger protein EHD3-like n=1 Tax=Typha latifolia TaxID=4733 RepID=UPI003C2C4258